VLGELQYDSLQPF